MKNFELRMKNEEQSLSRFFIRNSKFEIRESS